MEENSKYRPEYNLLQDAYLGSREVLQKKLLFLSNMVQTFTHTLSRKHYPDIADYFTSLMLNG